MTTAAESRAYHHGDLSNALLDAAMELARSDGPAGVTIRAVTRNVGVSPSAAYRHFADVEELTLAAARRANVLLGRSMAAATGELDAATPRDEAINRLRGVGLGYIRFALAEPGWASLAFTAQGQAAGPTEPTEPWVGVEGTDPSPFELLTGALDAMVEAGALHPSRRPHAEWPCWSTVHGFGELVQRGPLRRLPRALVDHLAVRCVDTIIAGLDVPTSHAGVVQT